MTRICEGEDALGSVKRDSECRFGFGFPPSGMRSKLYFWIMVCFVYYSIFCIALIYILSRRGTTPVCKDVYVSNFLGTVIHALREVVRREIRNGAESWFPS